MWRGAGEKMLFEGALQFGRSILAESRSILAESRSKQELLMDTEVPFEFLVSLMKYFKTNSEGSLRTILLKFEI